MVNGDESNLALLEQLGAAKAYEIQLDASILVFAKVAVVDGCTSHVG